MKRLLAVAGVALAMSLTACSVAVTDPAKVPSPGGNQQRVTGKIVTINIPASADSYVSMEMQADGESNVVPYYCNPAPICRLLQKDDRITYTLTKDSLFLTYVVRAPQV